MANPLVNVQDLENFVVMREPITKSKRPQYLYKKYYDEKLGKKYSM